jgi:hypothetical protein
MGLLHKIGDGLLVGFEGLEGGGLVVLRQSAVTGYIGAENSGKLAAKAFRFHAVTSWERGFGKSRLKELSPE